MKKLIAICMTVLILCSMIILPAGGEGNGNGAAVYGYTIDRLATRKGPGTQYAGGGTYNVKHQWIRVLAKAWDSRNSIWWIKCEIPYKDEIRVLWTGYKRFDKNTLTLDELPDETPGGQQEKQSGKKSGNPSKNGEIYGYTKDKLATRKGPGTQYEGGGTYNVKHQWIRVLAKAWDKRNSIWWVKCRIPYKGEYRVLWTGYKRFDKKTLSLDDLPEENW